METLGFVALLLCILAVAAISRRVQGTILPLPMLYAAFGLLLGSLGLGLIHADVESEGIRIIAETTALSCPTCSWPSQWRPPLGQRRGGLPPDCCRPWFKSCSALPLG